MDDDECEQVKNDPALETTVAKFTPIITAK